MAPLIMLIDDDPAVLETIRECLRPSFTMRIAAAGKKVWNWLA